MLPCDKEPGMPILTGLLFFVLYAAVVNDSVRSGQLGHATGIIERTGVPIAEPTTVSQATLQI